MQFCFSDGCSVTRQHEQNSGPLPPEVREVITVTCTNFLQGLGCVSGLCSAPLWDVMHQNHGSLLLSPYTRLDATQAFCVPNGFLPRIPWVAHQNQLVWFKYKQQDKTMLLHLIFFVRNKALVLFLSEPR